MLVLNNSVGGGTKNGMTTTLGVKLGTLTHALLAAVGFAAVLMQFAAFYTLMKSVGAAYLVLLGCYSAYKSFTAPKQASLEDVPVTEKKFGRCVMEGFLSNILNPKVVVFYVAVLPQFIAPGDPVFLTTALLASIHIGVSLLWLLGVSIGVGSAKRWLTKPKTKAAIGTVAGLAIAAFGVRLALSSK